jgi:hypothetical protein
MAGNFKNRLPEVHCPLCKIVPGGHVDFISLTHLAVYVRLADLAGIFKCGNSQQRPPGDRSACTASSTQRDYFQRINTHCGMIGVEFN